MKVSKKAVSIDALTETFNALCKWNVREITPKEAMPKIWNAWWKAKAGLREVWNKKTYELDNGEKEEKK